MQRLEVTTDTSVISNENDHMYKYDAFSRAFYIVNIRKVSAGGKTKKQIPAIAVANKITKINIKFNQIEKYGFNTWKITFQNKSLANNAISNNYLKDLGFIAFIPRYKICRKIVIKDMPLEDIKVAIEEENSNIVINKIFRLKARNRITKEFVESNSICLEIKGESIPKELYILRTVNKVFPYIPSIRMCYKCGSLGHLSKACTKTERCLSCAGEHTSSRENPCKLNLKCVNCGGNHNTLNRSCPILIKQKEIVRIMAVDNLPFLEARNLAEKNQTSNLKLKNL